MREDHRAAVGPSFVQRSQASGALHRYAENIVTVNRTWPVDLTRMLTDDAVRAGQAADVAVGTLLNGRPLIA
ncbi:hypothetical protein [Streptomyces beigongshangae]|uniref:hypothetical protein n=1 Tax=Streptomyces beigongshangae TaxID=2841597 RepID=UPI001C855B90|nr:hypothetical protein [Streptomyces sp. REN17]